MRFAHNAERQFAKLLDFYAIAWEYEPRTFVLERDAEDLGGSSIVCIDGLSKPPRTAAHPRDYRRVKRYGVEFRKRRTVLE